ncbi:MAG: gamma-glutamylcyclotransferase family protein [Hyphomicrobiaceae bacterium]|nr:gamma-glutamylcyclotransferase family protein [Hyphomicrobiaceae bacterium]
MCAASSGQRQSCRLLFVYGTLMPTATSELGRAERQLLAAGATVLGPASIQGRLYDLGGYPGLVTGLGEDVEGEVLSLADPDATWSWLDAYEGIGSAEGQPTDAYTRKIVGVRPRAGPTATQHAWAYIYTGPMDGLIPLSVRRWVAA